MITLSGPAGPTRIFARNRFLTRGWPWFAAVASGGLLALGLEPWNQAWLCWLALTPLLAAVWSTGTPPNDPADHSPAVSTPARWRIPAFWREPWARAFALGYLAGLVFFWSAFYWLWQVTGPGWFLLSPYMACYFAAWTVFMATVAKPKLRPSLTQRIADRSKVRAYRGNLETDVLPASPFLRSRWNLWTAFLAAAAWVALEWMRSWMLSGFGWNDLGVSLHGNIPLIQIAEWTGVGGVSFLVAFVNVIALVSVYRFMAEMRIHKLRPHFDFTLTLCGLLLVFSFGLRTMQGLERGAALPGATAPLRVAAVQANIAQSDTWQPAWQTASFKSLRELSETALATKPDLLLWPEAATPRGLFGDRENYEFVMAIARLANCNFLLGTLDYDFGPNGHAQADYNAAVLLPKGGGDAQVYRKIHLVPFGEYVPYRHEFPPLAWIVGNQVPSDLSRGTHPRVFETADPAVRLAPLICFEDTIGDLARQPVLRGAQLLVNLTNDAWFGFTAASHQQLAEATFRTVENRRPLVRCANNGVTAFLDSEGRLTQTLLMADGTVYGPGVLSGEIAIPLHPALTYYTQHGEAFSVACADIAGLAALFMVWRRLRNAELRRRARHGSAVEEPATVDVLP